jgi:hypothetical protein
MGLPNYQEGVNFSTPILQQKTWSHQPGRKRVLGK